MARTRRLRLGRPGTAAGLPAAPASPQGTVPPWSRAARPLALTVAGLRLVLGVTALAIPEHAGRAWVGESARGRGPAVLLRAMGARDIALGAGALLSARQGRDLRRWVLLGGLSDLGDTIASAAGFDALPRRSRWLVLVASGGAAVAAAASAPLLSVRS